MRQNLDDGMSTRDRLKYRKLFFFSICISAISNNNDTCYFQVFLSSTTKKRHVCKKLSFCTAVRSLKLLSKKRNKETKSYISLFKTTF
jgi:hypothetical protein